MSPDKSQLWIWRNALVSVCVITKGTLFQVYRSGSRLTVVAPGRELVQAAFSIFSSFGFLESGRQRTKTSAAASPHPRGLLVLRETGQAAGPGRLGAVRGSAKAPHRRLRPQGGEDNPHRIFETMNACGRDLTCADMVGNFILMPLDRERQERLYADHLRPIECGFERHAARRSDAPCAAACAARPGQPQGSRR